MSTLGSVRMRDGDTCEKCKTKFGFFTGKQNCRRCAGSFCGKCTHKISITTPSGAKVEANIRLCDPCHEIYIENVLNPLQSNSRMDQLINNEEEELQMAIALSTKEAQKSTLVNRQLMSADPQNYLSAIEENELKAAIDISLREAETKQNQWSTKSHMPAIKRQESSRSSTPSLSMYLNRGYWEQRKAEHESQVDRTNPVIDGIPRNSVAKSDGFTAQGQSVTTIEDGIAETMQFCQTTKEEVDFMDARMRSNLSRGGSISNDNGIRSLASRLIKCQGHVLSLITKLESDREYFVSLQNGLEYINECKQLVSGMRTAYMRGLEEYLKQSQQMSRIHMQQQLKLARQKIHGKSLMQQSMQVVGKQQQLEMPSLFSGSLFTLSNQMQAALENRVLVPASVQSSIEKPEENNEFEKVVSDQQKQLVSNPPTQLSKSTSALLQNDVADLERSLISFGLERKQ